MVSKQNLERFFDASEQKFRKFAVYFCPTQWNSEPFSLPRNASEQNFESLHLFPYNGTEFRAFFSSVEWFGMWEFSVLRNSRNSIGDNHLFRLFRLPENNFFVGNCQPYSSVVFSTCPMPRHLWHNISPLFPCSSNFLFNVAKTYYIYWTLLNLIFFSLLQQNPIFRYHFSLVQNIDFTLAWLCCCFLVHLSFQIIQDLCNSIIQTSEPCSSYSVTAQT
jgi:hypothetical protein